MGCVPRIPGPDEQGGGKKYAKFLIVLEILYAILMAWGFARVAEFFDFENIYDWATLIIAMLVLVRFFFAPSHNVGALVSSLPVNIVNARKIIFLDIPILIFHSLLYYRMCYNASLHLYDLFYFDLMALLILNAAWLFWIRKRLEYSKKSVPEKFCLWIANNLVFAVFLALAWLLFKSLPWFTGKALLKLEIYFWLSFIIAILNCVIDLSSCALEYFEDV